MLKFSAIDIFLKTFNNNNSTTDMKSRIAMIREAIAGTIEEFKADAEAIIETVRGIEEILRESISDDGNALLYQEEIDEITRIANKDFVDRLKGYQELSKITINRMLKYGIDLNKLSFFPSQFDQLISSGVSDLENPGALILNADSVLNLISDGLIDPITRQEEEINIEKGQEDLSKGLSSKKNALNKVIMNLYNISGLEFEDETEDPKEQAMLKQIRVRSIAKMIGYNVPNLSSDEKWNILNIAERIYNSSQSLGGLLEEDVPVNVTQYAEFINSFSKLMHGNPLISRVITDNFGNIGAIERGKKKISKNKFVIAFTEIREILDTMIKIDETFQVGLNQYNQKTQEEIIKESDLPEDRKKFFNEFTIPGKRIFNKIRALDKINTGNLEYDIYDTEGAKDDERELPSYYRKIIEDLKEGNVEDWMYSTKGTIREDYLGKAQEIFYEMVQYVNFVMSGDNLGFAVMESGFSDLVKTTFPKAQQMIQQVNGIAESQPQNQEIYLESMSEFRTLFSELFLPNRAFSPHKPSGQAGIKKELYLMHQDLFEAFSEGIVTAERIYEEINKNIDAGAEDLSQSFTLFLNVIEQVSAPIYSTLNTSAQKIEDERYRQNVQKIMYEKAGEEGKGQVPESVNKLVSKEFSDSEDIGEETRELEIYRLFERMLGLIKHVKKLIPEHMQEPTYKEQPGEVFSKKNTTIKKAEIKPFNLKSYKINSFNLRRKKNANR